MVTDFDIYLERYCEMYHVTPEQAKEHVLVKEVKKMYEEVDP